MEIERKNIYQKPVTRILLSLFTCFLWGSAFPAVKEGFILFNITDSGSKILFAGYRFFAAGIVTLIIISLIGRKFTTIKVSSIPAIIVQGLLQTTIQYVLFYIGLSNTTGAKGSIINGSNAFFSILFAHFLIKNEKANLKTIVGCMIGFLGVILVNYNGESFLAGWTFMGEGLILLCTIVYGLSSVTLKIATKKESPNAIAAYQLIIGGFLLMILGLALGGKVEGFTLASTLLFAYLVAIPAISFCLWGNLLKYNPVGKITIFGFSISFFGTMLSGICLGESVFNPLTLASLTLVSAGVIIVNIDSSKSK